MTVDILLNMVGGEEIEGKGFASGGQGDPISVGISKFWGFCRGREASARGNLSLG